MEREYKFRGINKIGSWVYGDLRTYYDHHAYKECVISERLYMPKWVEVVPETVGQFTGLTDKNGKDIYEGDIVLCYYGVEPTATGAKETIEFKNGSFWLRHRDISLAKWIEFDGTYTSELEIIGNIYENPNLLTHE